MPQNGMPEMFSVNYNNKTASQFNEYVSYVVVRDFIYNSPGHRLNKMF